MSVDAVREHYTKVCRCVWDGDDEWPTRVEATADCVIHGSIPDPLDALLAENQQLREQADCAGDSDRDILVLMDAVRAIYVWISDPALAEDEDTSITEARRICREALAGDAE